MNTFRVFREGKSLSVQLFLLSNFQGKELRKNFFSIFFFPDRFLSSLHSQSGSRGIIWPGLGDEVQPLWCDRSFCLHGPAVHSPPPHPPCQASCEKHQHPGSHRAACKAHSGGLGWGPGFLSGSRQKSPTLGTNPDLVEGGRCQGRARGKAVGLRGGAKWGSYPKAQEGWTLWLRDGQAVWSVKGQRCRNHGLLRRGDRAAGRLGDLKTQVGRVGDQFLSALHPRCVGGAKYWVRHK